MVTGSTLGHIALWDLEEKRLRSQMWGAHFSAVSGMQCLPSEPLMVTSAGDNSLKVENVLMEDHKPTPIGHVTLLRI